jgi:hypothetical protein
MKLQEAFMERNDIKKKISRVQLELHTVIVTEKDEEKMFDPTTKFEECQTLMKNLLALNIKIDKANVVNSERLLKLREMDANIALHSSIRQRLMSASNKQSLGYGSDTIIEMEKNFDIHGITEMLEDIEKGRRDLDRELQKANWEIEV